MYILILLLLIGISFVPLLTPLIAKDFYIWAVHGAFTQLMIALMFSYSFFEKPKRVLPNKPLGLLHCWVTITTGILCFTVMYETQNFNYGQINSKMYYAVNAFGRCFNFLCIVILYKCIVDYITKAQILRILVLLKYVIVITLFTCFLQKIGYSQFFQLLTKHATHNNLIAGFLGNGTHLSGYLASCIPLFLWKGKREDWLCIIAMLIILCFTGTTLGDPAISGFIVFIGVWLFFYKKNFKVLVPSLMLLAGAGWYIFPKLPPQFFAVHSRFEFFGKLIPQFRTIPVTGAGLGFVTGVGELYPVVVDIAVTGGREKLRLVSNHVHNEYLQYMVELGIIGLILILNLINRFIGDKAETREQLVLKSIVVGFLISCMFNYPAHLWIPSVWCIFAYASYNVLKGAQYD